MSENAITSISNSWQPEASPPALPPAKTDYPPTPRLGAPVQTDSALPADSAASKPGAPAEPKPASEEKPVLPVNNNSNLTLRFLVDEKTNDLTVFVVDRNSKRVLRSIPAAELSKLNSGDLLKLTA